MDPELDSELQTEDTCSSDSSQPLGGQWLSWEDEMWGGGTLMNNSSKRGGCDSQDGIEMNSKLKKPEKISVSR